MKIQVIQREFNDSGYCQKSYKVCDCKCCCDGIKKLPNIDFYFEYAENTGNPIEEEGVSLDLGIMMQRDVTTYDPWEPNDLGYTQEFFYKLNYCPICGEKIEVEIVDNIDVSEEIKQLREKHAKLTEKFRTTDSIKKKTEYSLEIQRTNKEIDSYYQTDHIF